MSLTGVFRFRIVAWILVIALVFGLLLVLQGCTVSSVNPLYDEGSIFDSHPDPDVVFDQSLIGSWTATYDRC